MTNPQITTPAVQVKPMFAMCPAPATEPVNLPADLLADARPYHAGLMARRAESRFKIQSFENWLADLVRDSVYGPGVDAGAAEQWLEHRTH